MNKRIGNHNIQIKIQSPSFSAGTIDIVNVDSVKECAVWLYCIYSRQRMLFSKPGVLHYSRHQTARTFFLIEPCKVTTAITGFPFEMKSIRLQVNTGHHAKCSKAYSPFIGVYSRPTCTLRACCLDIDIVPTFRTKFEKHKRLPDCIKMQPRQLLYRSVHSSH